MIKKDERLKPCPFCGEEPNIVWNDDKNGWIWVKAQCILCGCQTRATCKGTLNDKVELAIRAWNRRTT